MIVAASHEKNVTRSILSVEKDYRGFKISARKDNRVNRIFTSKLKQNEAIRIIW